VSAFTLFFSHLRGPKISHSIGPTFLIYYREDGGFGIYLPVTFLNESPTTGIVFRCAIRIIFAKSTPEDPFFMPWRSFCRFAEKKDTEKTYITEEEFAHAITVPPKSSTAKLVLFISRPRSEPALRIVEGQMIFQYWTGLAGKSDNEQCKKFSIDVSKQSELDGYLKIKSKKYVELELT